MLVNYEGLAILSLLKIQSGPLGNLRDTPFDGDEMNMHAPQNVLAETELRHLAAIPYQVISPAGNAPIIGIYQDSLLWSYRFTRPNISFTPRDVMNLLMMYSKVDTAALRELSEQNSGKIFVESKVGKTMFIIKFSNKDKNRKSVVIVEYPRKGVWAVGFATKENKGEMAVKTKQKLINVFVPTTPNPTSGFLLMFPKEDVIYLDMSFEEASKFIVSAGTSNPKS